jgi:chemotaxis protein MotB
MGKLSKKGASDGEESNWLMSYADMMTLIACFFILMMAFANYDPVGFTKKTKVVSQHFNKAKYKSSMTEMEHLKEELSKHPELKDMTKITIDDGALIVAFSGTVLFEPGTFTLMNNSTQLLDTMIELIKDRNPNYRIVSEGHTDNQLIPRHLPFTSNWALSSARASAVIERFEVAGFDPKKLLVLGMGDTKPLLPNEDKSGRPIEENMKLNRRVVIKVLEPKNKGADQKLGLGAYFQDSTGRNTMEPSNQ